MRKNDINDLLVEIGENIRLIKLEYEKAKSSEEIKEVLKPKVKSTLEHLRSCLEYSTNDIYDLIIKPHKNSSKQSKLYFPYGRTKSRFVENQKKYLPNLKQLNIDIFNLLLSIQDFKNKEKWLFEMCSYTNEMKHKNLTAQSRFESRTTTIPGLVKVSGNSSVKFVNSVYAIDTPSGRKEIPLNFTLDNTKPLPVLDSRLNASQRIDWVDFKFKDTNTSVLTMLNTAYNKIKKFVDDLYHLLPK